MGGGATTYRERERECVCGDARYDGAVWELIMLYYDIAAELTRLGGPPREATAFTVTAEELKGGAAAWLNHESLGWGGRCAAPACPRL